jgi:hypothetical protein
VGINCVDEWTVLQGAKLPVNPQTVRRHRGNEAQLRLANGALAVVLKCYNSEKYSDSCMCVSGFFVRPSRSYLLEHHVSAVGTSILHVTQGHISGVALFDPNVSRH